MRKTLLFHVIAVAASLSSFAFHSRIADIEVADVNSQLKAYSKLGELAGNPMLGAFFAGCTTANPVASLIGSPRPDSSIYISVWENSNVTNEQDILVLYPVGKNIEDSLLEKNHQKDTNGVWCIKDETQQRQNLFAVLSPSSNDLIIATSKPLLDKKNTIKRGILGTGELAAVSLNGRLFRELFANSDSSKNIVHFNEENSQLVKKLDSLNGAVKISDKGISFEAAFNFDSKETVDKMISTNKISITDLYDAPSNSLMVAVSSDCTNEIASLVKIFEELTRKNGATNSTLVVESKNGKFTNYEINIENLPKIMAEDDSNEYDGFDLGRLEILAKKANCITNSSPHYCALSIKGVTNGISFSNRVANAAINMDLPELQNVSVVAFSGILYAILNNELRSLDNSIPSLELTMIKNMAKALPQDFGKGCVFCAVYRKDPKSINFRVCVSPEEVKSLSTLSNIILILMSSVAESDEEELEEIEVDE